MTTKVSPTRWVGVAAIAVCNAACSGSAGHAHEKTGSVGAAQVAPLACTELVADGTPLFSCGANGALELGDVSRIRARLDAEMRAAFASLRLAPDFEQNQLVITSRAAPFHRYFGERIVAPLTQAGLFTTTITLAGVGAIAPDLHLIGDMFGVVPGPCSLSVLDPVVSPFGGTMANGTFKAFHDSPTFEARRVNAATMPLTFFISTPPVAAEASLTCSGSIPLGCN